MSYKGVTKIMPVMGRANISAQVSKGRKISKVNKTRKKVKKKKVRKARRKRDY